jgi:hypothetical protein
MQKTQTNWSKTRKTGLKMTANSTFPIKNRLKPPPFISKNPQKNDVQHTHSLPSQSDRRADTHAHRASEIPDMAGDGLMSVWVLLCGGHFKKKISKIEGWEGVQNVG